MMYNDSRNYSKLQQTQTIGCNYETIATRLAYIEFPWKKNQKWARLIPASFIHNSEDNEGGKKDLDRDWYNSGENIEDARFNFDFTSVLTSLPSRVSIKGVPDNTASIPISVPIMDNAILNKFVQHMIVERIYKPGDLLFCKRSNDSYSQFIIRFIVPKHYNFSKKIVSGVVRISSCTFPITDVEIERALHILAGYEALLLFTKDSPHCEVYTSEHELNIPYNASPRYERMRIEQINYRTILDGLIYVKLAFEDIPNNLHQFYRDWLCRVSAIRGEVISIIIVLDFRFNYFSPNHKEWDSMCLLRFLHIALVCQALLWHCETNYQSFQILFLTPPSFDKVMLDAEAQERQLATSSNFFESALSKLGYLSETGRCCCRSEVDQIHGDNNEIRVPPEDTTEMTTRVFNKDKKKDELNLQQNKSDTRFKIVPSSKSKLEEQPNLQQNESDTRFKIVPSSKSKLEEQPNLQQNESDTRFKIVPSSKSKLEEEPNLQQNESDTRFKIVPSSKSKLKLEENISKDSSNITSNNFEQQTSWGNLYTTSCDNTLNISPTITDKQSDIVHYSSHINNKNTGTITLIASNRKDQSMAIIDTPSGAPNNVVTSLLFRAPSQVDNEDTRKSQTLYYPSQTTKCLIANNEKKDNIQEQSKTQLIHRSVESLIPYKKSLNQSVSKIKENNHSDYHDSQSEKTNTLSILPALSTDNLWDSADRAKSTEYISTEKQVDTINDVIPRASMIDEHDNHEHKQLKSQISQIEPSNEEVLSDIENAHLFTQAGSLDNLDKQDVVCQDKQSGLLIGCNITLTEHRGTNNDVEPLAESTLLIQNVDKVNYINEVNGQLPVKIDYTIDKPGVNKNHMISVQPTVQVHIESEVLSML